MTGRQWLPDVVKDNHFFNNFMMLSRHSIKSAITMHQINDDCSHFTTTKLSLAQILFTKCTTIFSYGEIL